MRETLQGSYVFSKSLANGPTNSSTSTGLKANYIYELPFGAGHRLLGGVLWSSFGVR